MPLKRVTAVSREAWAKLRDWACVAVRGRLLLSGSIAHASLKTTVNGPFWVEVANQERAIYSNVDILL